MRPFSQSRLTRLFVRLERSFSSASVYDKPAAERDFLSVLKNTVFFIAVHLYFAGWIYNFYFYQHFGINLGSLEIPFYYFFVYSFTVIYLNAIWFVGIGLIIALLTVLVEKYKHIKKWVIPSFLILLFPVTFYISKNSAGRAALNIRMGKGNTKTIVFIFKNTAGLGNEVKTDESPKPTSVGTNAQKPVEDSLAAAVPAEYRQRFLDANSSEALQLLVQTNNKYYVFFQPPGDADSPTVGDEELDIGYTFEVLNSDVELASIAVP